MFVISHKFKHILVISLSLLPHLLFSKLLFLKDPPPWPDEAYFLNVAEHLVRSGTFQTSLCGTYCPFNIHIRSYLGYPPLYLYLLSFWIHVFGPTLPSIRIFSIILSILTLLLFYVLLIQITKRKVLGGLGILLLTFFEPFVMASHIARMEIVILLCCIGMLCCCLEYEKTKKISYLVAACIFSIFAFLSHLIGAFVPGLLFFWILSKRPLGRAMKREVIVFAGSLCVSLIMWFVTIADHFNIFLEQLLAQFAFKSSRAPLLSLLFQNDPSWRILIFLYLSVASFAFFYGAVKKKDIFIKTSCGFFFVLFVVLYGKDQWYLVFLSFFPIILSVLFIQEIPSQKKFIPSVLFILPLILIGVLHAQNSISGALDHLKKNENYSSFVNGISRELPKGSTVLLASVPEPYFELRKRADLTLYHQLDFGDISSVLKNADIIVTNYATNKQLSDYLKVHVGKTIRVIQENGGYQTEVIFLKH